MMGQGNSPGEEVAAPGMAPGCVSEEGSQTELKSLSKGRVREARFQFSAKITELPLCSA